MEVQKLTHSDLHLIETLQPAGWPDIRPVVLSYTQSQFCFPIKVIVDGKVVGIGTEIVHGEVAWLAHIIVHSDNRNQGIGSLITEALVQSAMLRGCSTINLLATELGEPVYKKLGFLTETEYIFFKDLRLNKAIEFSENIVPFRYDYLDQVCSLDYEISGERRRAELEHHLSNSYVYLQDKFLTGFYIPTFGEGLIVAGTKLAGVELMKIRLTTKENAAFPIDNLEAKEFLYRHNYKEFKTAKRMSLGEKRSWKPEGIYNRIGGNLG